MASTPGTIASSALTETSGLVASRRNANVWYSNNDSGDSARVFALGNDGRDLGQLVFSGADAVDWEDVSVGPGPVEWVSYLYAADIGDNNKVRTSVQVYRVQEPAVDATAATPVTQTLTGVDRLTFVYPDGPRDAEGFFVDTTNGELYVVSKDLFGGVARVYRAPANLPAGSTRTLTFVASVPLGPWQGVTGAGITRAGDVIGLRTYFGVFLYQRTLGQTVAQALGQPSCSGATASETQGEAIAFTPDGRGYRTVSEGAHSALHQFVAP